MKTDDLIDALAAGLEPARPARLSAPLLGGAAAVAVLGVVLWLGVRPHFIDAFQGPALWWKAAYTLVLASTALWLGARLGKPGADVRRPAVSLVAIAIIAVACGGIELAAMPQGDRLAAWLGHSWTVCGRNIFVISLFAGPLVFLSARKFAPTRPGIAGFALGVAAGGIAATVYGLLYCGEVSVAFVATWYSLGVLAAGLTGAAAGHFALRW